MVRQTGSFVIHPEPFWHAAGFFGDRALWDETIPILNNPHICSSVKQIIKHSTKPIKGSPPHAELERNPFPNQLLLRPKKIA